jgi:hypothetical protein
MTGYILAEDGGKLKNLSYMDFKKRFGAIYKIAPA